MLHKYGKWYADWRDESGKRKRKAFRTKNAAKRHEERMRAQAITKKEPRPARSGNSRRSGRRHKPERKPKATRAASPKN